MKFLQRVKQTIEKNRLIEPGDTILIGVSGGADSIALLESLDHLRKEWGLKLFACHVNHGLRKSADTDQRFVEKLCQKKSIPCAACRISIPKNSKDSLEQLAREKRFTALIKTAQKLNADKIALGHHLNDLAETVLMRIIRGSGLQGLQAIVPVRKIKGMTFIRPLLSEKRKDIEQFLAEKKISYRNDPTNTSDRFFRNKVRHKLLNCLATKYNPNIQETLARLAETSSLDYEFLSRTADEAFKNVLVKKEAKSVSLNILKLRRLHQALRRMVFRHAIILLNQNSRKITLTHIHHIESLLNQPRPINTQVHLPHHMTVTRVKNRLCFAKV